MTPAPESMRAVSRGAAPEPPPWPMDGRPPLSALLSQAMVAFTIEFDNEFERQMPHRHYAAGRDSSGEW